MSALSELLDKENWSISDNNCFWDYMSEQLPLDAMLEDSSPLDAIDEIINIIAENERFKKEHSEQFIGRDILLGKQAIRIHELEEEIKQLKIR